MAFARTIVEEKQVTELMDKETKATPRLGEVFEGLQWFLARGPERGYKVPGGNKSVWLIRSRAWPGIDGVITLAYTFDNDNVYLLRARVERGDAAAAIKIIA